jgi:putative proteasome-type protease
MTYCLGILTKEGILGIADTRITSGRDTTVAKKIYCVQRENHAFFIMTSGLRSVRDKAITYFGEVIEDQDKDFTKLYKAVNKFGEQVKRVAKEDRKMLQASGMNFNLHAIVGGQFEEDEQPGLYMLYPEGNWIKIGETTPYIIIGNSGFGNPVLKRSVTFNSSLEFCLKSGYLSFEATRISANDVGYPLDTVILKKNEFKLTQHRFEAKDLRHIGEFWNQKLTEAIEKLPADALFRAFQVKDKQPHD